MTTLLWFRRDLRTADNPALSAAVDAGGAVIPVYVHAPEEEAPWRPGGASRWWLHHSLGALAEDLASRGSRLTVRSGADSLEILLALARETGATRVMWNRLYEPACTERDRRVKSALRAAGLLAESFDAALLHEPWTVNTQSGGPFQVFTPFWRHCKRLADPPPPHPAPRSVPAPARWPGTETLDSLRLAPVIAWDGGLRESWTPGSRAAHATLQRFLDERFAAYADSRNFPDRAGTSRLSPHLHFGEIGPRELWHATRRHAEAAGRHPDWRDSTFLAEVGWREFAHHLLFHFPHTPQAPLRAAYARFPWRSDPASLAAWRGGRTGYPIVDAGMRELWRTGWMHNRVRMIVASFLVKDLLIAWTEGAHWFWDTLVDADLASNTLGWQWAAGCGADAAPYFRIFNPVSQGAKFDPTGAYVRRWVPELAGLPDDVIHQPWVASPDRLRVAGVTLGVTYPPPIVDHGQARQAALAALASLKSAPAAPSGPMPSAE